jgi:hypothetical protein
MAYMLCMMQCCCGAALGWCYFWNLFTLCTTRGGITQGLLFHGNWQRAAAAFWSPWLGWACGLVNIELVLSTTRRTLCPVLLFPLVVRLHGVHLRCWSSVMATD